MKKVITLIVCCSVSVGTFAGDTNFVAQLKTMWQTHNASNILVFVEQNVATNRSPETLFARGIIASNLQLWKQGATNYWEQAAQMISTNTVYSAQIRTNVAEHIRGFYSFFMALSPDNSPPSWNTNAHDWFFSRCGDEPTYFDILEIISTLETVEQ